MYHSGSIRWHVNNYIWCIYVCGRILSLFIYRLWFNGFVFFYIAKKHAYFWVCVFWLNVPRGNSSFDRRSPPPFKPYGTLSGEHTTVSINIIFHFETWRGLLYTVMHCSCGALCIIHQPSLAAETESQTNKINILPLMWQCAMHQILLCAQRIISQGRIISEWPQGGRVGGT